MERLKERLQTSEEARATLEEGLAMPASEIVRDAAIWRFGSSFESVWKAAQLYLAKVENIETGSPAGVIRGCWKAGILDEGETQAALKMAADRNLTARTYCERLAVELFERLPGHAALLRAWLERIRARV